MGQAQDINLAPVMWETHAIPEMGDRPQSIINRQIVDDCDILVGVFWTRIGSPTGAAVSGTAEEIDLFIEARKPALIYFSSVPINPNEIDIEQYQKLTEFKKETRFKGLLGTFDTLEELRVKLHADLTRLITRLQDATIGSQGATPKAVSNIQEVNVERVKCETNIERIPFEALSRNDSKYWQAKGLQHLIEQGVPSIGPNAIKSMAQGLYREATRTTQDLQQEFLAGQREAMRRDRISEDEKKAASRLPNKGSK